jgi:hypothetical protein
MLGRADQGFVDINAIALKAAISGTIFAVLDASLRLPSRSGPLTILRSNAGNFTGP